MEIKRKLNGNQKEMKGNWKQIKRKLKGNQKEIKGN